MHLNSQKDATELYLTQQDITKREQEKTISQQQNTINQPNTQIFHNINYLNQMNAENQRLDNLRRAIIDQMAKLSGLDESQISILQFDASYELALQTIQEKAKKIIIRLQKDIQCGSRYQ